MIIKGQSRGRSRQLAAHLLRADQNERIRLYETRGTVAQDVENALAEMEAHGAAMRCKRPLYHASISPEAHMPLSDDQIRIALDILETTLGLDRQPRLVIIHEKGGREHVHVVWSRADVEHCRAIPDFWNYRHHEHAARALEALFGHAPVLSSHERRGPKKSGPRTAKDYELRQEGRGGKKSAAITAELTSLWNGSADARTFVARLEAAGYRLARGDRRVFVVVDRHGEVHSLARRIEGATTRDIRARLRDVDLQALPSVAEARPPAPPRGVPSRFTRAAFEVARRDPERSPRERAPRGRHPFVARTRAMLAEVVEPATTWRRTKPMRVRARAAAPQQRQTYRGMRAILVAEFASKIANARRNIPEQELAAAIAALLAEREAALEALAEKERGKAVARRRFRSKAKKRAARPLRIKRLRFRRWRSKST